MDKFGFKPFDKVLVRDEESDDWGIQLFDRYKEGNSGFPYYCINRAFRFCIPYNDETKHLLGTTDPYEEPYEPKDGDFIVIGNDRGVIAIYRKDNKLRPLAAYAAYCDRLKKLYKTEDLEDFIEIASPSTEEEKQLLLDKLHENGKDWNAEKKEVVDWKWKPEKGEEYRTVVFSATTKEFVSCWYHWFGSDVDLNTFEKGWVFKTKEAADKLAKELNEKLFGKEN